MKEYESIEFAEDTDLRANVVIKGSGKALGNLKVSSMSVTGSLVVEKDLECLNELRISGSCFVKGNIKADSIVNTGTLEVTGIKAAFIGLEGNVTVNADITAEKSISIILSPKRKNLTVTGLIKAPEVTLRSAVFYTKWSSVPGKLLGRLGKKRRYKRELVIENLRIETDKLVLDSPYPVDMVEYHYVNCDIYARETELVSIPPPTPPRPHQGTNNSA
ncbi:MAG: polymer-forming cytoskeletal protein [Candidatus Odinarchaeota archaeon]